ncbi:H-NS family nucleoid-associated regulatory protein [Limnobacter sp. MED105]|uniref:H-NS family nucleoid-associated regulatory protein n=1 Tax=Limnobacter sp. MED105 TaxID=391597 RepID=UPI000156C34B|nr:H-NS family nucleoid-associated regulatory protein [Limnobacter sp. MED105]EDM82802.1 hypothetical protein LMED105_16113 [Limnobacter sp. MED105]
MDFQSAINQMKAKEEALAKEKDQLKGAALNQIRELVALFGISSAEIFTTPKKPAAAKSTVDYSAFEVGKTYSDGVKTYKFASKGKRPDWLKKAIEEGKTAKDLITK